jgi:pyruvate,water dikinase
MADNQTLAFPDPHEYEPPKEMEGWEEMYPENCRFSSDRGEWEKAQFWYQDRIHVPEPLPPLDHIFQEAWQIALSQNTTRVFCIPPAQGIAQRMVGPYMWIAPLGPPPDEVMGQKAAVFEKRMMNVFDNYDAIWDKWIAKFRSLGEEMENLPVPEEMPAMVPEDQVIPFPKGAYASYDLIDAFNKIVSMMFKGWQYHFELLNLTYLAYLMFGDTAKKIFPNISESAIGKMVAGADVSMYRPDEELCRLARLAVSLNGVAEILKKDTTAAQKISALEQISEGKQWLSEFDKAKNPWFYISCGGGWYHYEGSWTTKLDYPYNYIKGYIEQLEKGEKIERDLAEVDRKRQEIVAEYRELIQSDEDRASFDNAFKMVRTIFVFAENHLFWVEHWFHTIWFAKIREFGKIMVAYDMINEVDDIFMFNRHEIPVMLSEIATSWALGIDIPVMGAKYKAKAEKRKKILEAARDWNPSPALGNPPEEMAEPFTIMLWGINQNTVNEWLRSAAAGDAEDVNELVGFPSSAGVVEGTVRVIRRLEQLAELQEGEILACPTTSPSWAPVFNKIKATITDIGGIASHAAIVCREYGVPSVTGTGYATSKLKSGDKVRVDGDRGIVTILERAN